LAKKYSEVLENPQRPPKLSMLSNDRKREVMPALSNLSKFLGIYECWKAIINGRGTKWERRSVLEARAR